MSDHHFHDASPGSAFGRWIVLASVPVAKAGAHRKVSVRCACGATGVVRVAHLKSGRSKSCGCLRRELMSQPSENLSAPGDYKLAHQRVSRRRGRASVFLCVDCGASADDWSYDESDPDELSDGARRWSASVDHYQPRCRSCHRAFDSAARSHRAAS